MSKYKNTQKEFYAMWSFEQLINELVRLNKLMDSMLTDLEG